MLDSRHILNIRNIKMHFPIAGGLFGRPKGYVYAVDDVSFSLKMGQTLGLVGESGCGKSTLGRTILRLYEPTAGSIEFNGKDFLALSAAELRRERRNLQLIFQDPFSSLNPRMTVEAILSEPYQIHGIGTSTEIKRNVRELLIEVGLPSEAAIRYPHEFSGGQRQRIGIARAIALKPKLIIADEPVSALDVSIQSQILNLLADLRDKMGLSFLFIAHDLAVIEHISDVVAVMYLGKIVELAEAEKIYLSPKHPYTKALISAIPVPEFGAKKARQILKGDVPSPIAPPSGCYFHPRCPSSTEKCRVEAPMLRNVDNKKEPHLASCHYA